MIVIKRNGDKVEFDKSKIRSAVYRACAEVSNPEDWQIDEFADYIADKVTQSISHCKEVSVEDIQDVVERWLMRENTEAPLYEDIAKAYIKYRYKRALTRKANTTDQTIKELLEGNSDYWNKENSNKDARVAHTQRDYIAGITSTDITRRFLLPKEIVEAHDAGIIHFHDMDYFAQNAIHNCELINLNDILQNGTVMNGVMIDKPHRIATAATIATQVIAAVTSSSYGGATISLTHLAPFVRSSYYIYLEKYKSWGFDEKEAIQMAEKDTQKEVKDAVQTFLYQTNSMTNTNGQAPFLSVFMYLNETEEYKKELALLIEEFLKQRILGFKNRVGVYVAPAFPKYLYVLEEDNIHEDSPYWYLTQLAAECTAKRMVPDYISEKEMKQTKLSKGETPGNGDCYPCMGKRKL